MDDAVHDSQLLKGVLTMVLLHLIGERESYGYDLVERVHALGLAGVPDGSIYPALNRMEREGCFIRMEVGYLYRLIFISFIIHHLDT